MASVAKFAIPSTMHYVHWLWANWDPAHSACSASVALASEAQGNCTLSQDWHDDLP